MFKQTCAAFLLLILSGLSHAQPGWIFADGFEEAWATIVTPADNTIFSDADDAYPVEPGFQVSVTFATSGEVSFWYLTTQAGCDSAFEGCSAAVPNAEGVVTNPGGEEPMKMITLNLTGQTSYQQINLITVNPSGTAQFRSVRITVIITNCSLAFTDLPPGDWYNGSVCANGNDCASANVAITVVQGGNCVGISSVRLFNGASLMATDSNPTVGETSGFNLLFDDGMEFHLMAKAFEADNEIGSSATHIRGTDFTLPVVDFISSNVNGFQTAGTDETAVYDAASDINPVVPGMQFHARVSVADINVDGGQITNLTATGSDTIELFPANVTMPVPLTGVSPVAQNLLDLTLADLQTHTVSVVGADAAGNQASANFTAEVDLTPPPDPPTMLGTNPPSPANDNNPEIFGTAEAGTIVRLYSDPTCLTLLTSGTAESFGTTGITISVADNSTTTISTTAIDAADNVSACSEPLDYVEDSIPPG